MVKFTNISDQSSSMSFRELLAACAPRLRLVRASSSSCVLSFPDSVAREAYIGAGNVRAFTQHLTIASGCT